MMFLDSRSVILFLSLSMVSACDRTSDSSSWHLIPILYRALWVSLANCSVSVQCSTRLISFHNRLLLSPLNIIGLFMFVFPIFCMLPMVW